MDDDDYYDGEEYDEDEYDDEEEDTVLYKTALESFVPSSLAHSAYVSSDHEGYVAFMSKKDYCYADMFCSYDGVSLKAIVLFFGSTTIDNAYKPEMWCDWVINRSQYKDAFITKDAAKGLKSGFEVDTKCTVETMKAGMMCLRHAFEFTNWSWSKLVELGFDEWESYALATHFSYNEGEGFTEYYGLPDNHLVIPQFYRYGAFLGVAKEKDCAGTIYDFPDESFSLSSHWLGDSGQLKRFFPKARADSELKVEGFFGEEVVVNSKGLSMEQLTDFLNKLKRID